MQICSNFFFDSIGNQFQYIRITYSSIHKAAGLMAPSHSIHLTGTIIGEWKNCLLSIEWSHQQERSLETVLSGGRQSGGC